MLVKTVVTRFCWISLLLSLSISCKDSDPETPLAPEILVIDPISATFGSTIKVVGYNFIVPDSSNRVTINGKEVKILDVGKAIIKVEIPEGLGSGTVVLSNSFGKAEGPIFTYAKRGVVSTFAGNGIEGYADGTGVEAQFRFPRGIAIDMLDNLYIADRQNNRIRKITTDGIVTTFAGNGSAASLDGTLLSAAFNSPYGGRFDRDGNLLIIESSRIRKILLSSSNVITVTGAAGAGYNEGHVSGAKFNNITGIEINSQGDLLVSDRGNNKIRKIIGDIVTSFAGNGLSGSLDGTGIDAQFNSLNDIVIDGFDNLFVTQFNAVRVVDENKKVATLLTTTNAEGIAIDEEGNLFVTIGNSIVKIGDDNEVIPIAGAGQSGLVNGVDEVARFNQPTGIAADSKGNLFVVDRVNHMIRKIEFK